MASRSEIPAPEPVVCEERSGDAVGNMDPSNGQEGLPAGSASQWKSPVTGGVTAGTSLRKQAEAMGPQAAQKSR